MARRTQLSARRKTLGLSQEQLAERCNASPYTVQRWEAGLVRPSPRYRPLLAEALQISLDDLGCLLEEHDAGLVYNSSISASLDAIQGILPIDRRQLMKMGFAATAAVAPSRDWLLATLDGDRTPGRVTNEQVTAIRAVFESFQALDVTRGGGYAREQLVKYFRTTVSPLLRAAGGGSPQERALFEAGAEQLYLLGWMNFDAGDHPLAQRYLIQALRLAQEARNPELGAHVMAGLADQATLTGHPEQGLQYARAGRIGLQAGHSPACLADLWALQARAEGVLGDKAAVAHSVLASQQAAEQVRPDTEPEWAKFIPGAYLHGEYANAFCDVGARNEAVHFGELSLRQAAEQGRARRGSLAHAALARAALADHDLEAATHAARQANRLSRQVQSSRTEAAVAEISRRLSPHQASPLVAAFFDEGAAAYLPQISS